MILNKTKSYCCDCGENHDAQVEVQDGLVLFTVLCPVKTQSVVISSDPELFSAIREKSFTSFENPHNKRYSWENVVEITGKCNYTCPVCYAGSSSDESFEHLSFDQMTERIKILKKQKRVYMTISGGEPTLHPDLFRFVKLAKRHGITSKMYTNGSVIGRDPAYAIRLKKSGIEYCYIQLDTFNPELHREIRDNEEIEIKKQALANAKRADLMIGTNTVVTRQNLREIGELVRFFLGHAPHVSAYNFICAVKASGRFDIDDNEMICREDVIKALVACGVVKGLEARHFGPLPRFRPLMVELHPDCMAITVIAIVKGKAFPMDDFIDMNRFYERLGRSRMKYNLILGSILFLIHAIRSTRWGKLGTVLKMIYGYIMKRGNHAFAVIGIEQFMNGIYQDIQRLKYCTTSWVLKNGAIMPGCVYNHTDQRRNKNIRLNDT